MSHVNSAQMVVVCRCAGWDVDTCAFAELRRLARLTPSS